MLNNDQLKTIGFVEKRFNVLDNDGQWTDIDESLCRLDYLSDAELLNEAYLLAERHRWANPKCTVDHPQEQCVVPLIVDAVNSLLEHYAGQYPALTSNHKMIFQYYLALDYARQIIY